MEMNSSLIFKVWFSFNYSLLGINFICDAKFAKGRPLAIKGEKKNRKKHRAGIPFKSWSKESLKSRIWLCNKEVQGTASGKVE